MSQRKGIERIVEERVGESRRLWRAALGVTAAVGLAAACGSSGSSGGGGNGAGAGGSTTSATSSGTATSTNTGTSTGASTSSTATAPPAYGSAAQSCAGGLSCAGGTSCCDSIALPGGAFPMGGSVTESGPEAEPEHSATVAAFSLDTFEVTVGRFRKFVDAYTGAPPPDGAAAHPLIAGSGWKSAWNANLPATRAALVAQLVCDDTYPNTWTNTAGANEAKPITCVNWYEAFMFCAWDGGRLPTEAEWEYAAAGGAENRLYPWGAEAPSATLAVFNGAELTGVGSKPAGKARWGHLDMAGSLREWTLDLPMPYGTSCDNCAQLSPELPGRVTRSGDWLNPAAAQRSGFRSSSGPALNFALTGLRCARSL